MLFINKWSGAFQIFWGVILFLVFFVASVFFYDTSFSFYRIEYFILAIIALVVFIVSTGSIKLFESKVKLHKKSVLWGILTAIATIIIMVMVQVPIQIVEVFHSKLFFVSTMFSLDTAIFQESVCRGLLLSGFLDHEVSVDHSYKLTRAAIYSSILFCLMHLTNLNYNSASQVLMQLFFTFVIGLAFAALRITTNGLLWPIVLHFLFDWAPISLISHSTSHHWSFVFLLFLPMLICSVMYLIQLDKQYPEINYKK